MTSSADRAVNDQGARVLPFGPRPTGDSSPGSVRPGEPTSPRPGVREEPALREIVGEVLRDERLTQGRTLADVARQAAVSLPYLSEVERGRKDVSSEVLAAIGRALDLPMAVLLDRSARRLRGDRPTIARADGFRMRLAS